MLNRNPIRLIRSVPVWFLGETACIADQGPRFVRLFNQAWKQIPSGHRRIITAYWRTWAIGKLQEAPTVCLSDSLSTWERDPTRQTVAQCTHRGSRLSYWAAHIAWLPDEHALTSIAHGLSRVYWFAVTAHGKDVLKPIREDDLRDQLAFWRFDEVAAEEWRRANKGSEPRHPLLSTVNGES